MESSRVCDDIRTRLFSFGRGGPKDLWKIAVASAEQLENPQNDDTLEEYVLAYLPGTRGMVNSHTNVLTDRRSIIRFAIFSLSSRRDHSDSCLLNPVSCPSNMKVTPEIFMKTKEGKN
jgi:hypothetical protein